MDFAVFDLTRIESDDYISFFLSAYLGFFGEREKRLGTDSAPSGLLPPRSIPQFDFEPARIPVANSLKASEIDVGFFHTRSIELSMD